MSPIRAAFKLFDFFANCEYFETEFNYDEVLGLPVYQDGEEPEGPESPAADAGAYEYLGRDILSTIKVEAVGSEGMKIDRMFFEKFEDTVRKDEVIAGAVEAGQWDRVIDYVNQEVFDRPEEYYTLEKLRKAAAVDRRITLREILEKVFGLIPRFKSRDEMLEEEFSKFVADYTPEEVEAIPAIKNLLQGVRDQRPDPPHHRKSGLHRPGHEPGALNAGPPRSARRDTANSSLNTSRTMYR